MSDQETNPNIIPASIRPDGTWRKEIRVRPGMTCVFADGI